MAFTAITKATTLSTTGGCKTKIGTKVASTVSNAESAVTTTSTTTSYGSDLPNLDTVLGNLSLKQKKWNALSVDDKLLYIEDAQSKLAQAGTIATSVCDTWAGPTLKDLNGIEKLYATQVDRFLLLVLCKLLLDTIRETYQTISSKTKSTNKYKNVAKVLQDYKVETSNHDGQIIVNVLPLTSADKFGPSNQYIGQLYLDKAAATKPQDVVSFELDVDEVGNGKKLLEGVGLVLAAGNYGFLTVNDMLNTLFYKNQVCYVKHHPIRNELDIFIRFLFSKLYEDGYLNSEYDISLERSQQVVNHPSITSIHMTGGKASHDAIVWGTTVEEQKERKAKNEPKLSKSVTITSELGCVTPYIVTPYQYTDKELLHQADTIATCKLYNGGAACNSPQVLLVSDQWSQRNAFVKYLEEAIQRVPIPNAFYPGSMDRYTKFHEAYPKSSRVIRGVQPETIDGSNAVYIPILLVELELDLSTPEGIEQIKKEYALQNEAFGPVLIIATIKSSITDASDSVTVADKFLSNAVTVCNDYLFGTLSASFMVPDIAGVKSSPSSSTLNPIQSLVERTISGLKYGSIVLNAWSAAAYTPRLVWGGHIKSESIKNIQSGMGYINNSLRIRNVEKSVLRTPIIDSVGHITETTKHRMDIVRQYEALANVLIAPSFKTVTNLIGALLLPHKLLTLLKKKQPILQVGAATTVAVGIIALALRFAGVF